MTHVLDANACIHHLRHGTKSPVTARMSAAAANSFGVCSIVTEELYFGALRSNDPPKVWAEVATFLLPLVSLPYDDPAAEHFADIKAHLAATGRIIGPNDLLIAAIARANNLTLVTHNTGEFSRVPGLKIEDWEIP